MKDQIILAPSSAARRVKCPGSRALEALYREDDSPRAIEGRTAHWVAAKALKKETVCSGERADNGELITPEMIEGAALYADHVFQETKNENEMPAIFMTEVPLTMTDVHPLAAGTADCVAFGGGLGLQIWDYKFGFNFVDVFENWQLIYYAIGACETFKIQPEKITLWIIQPRYYGSEGKIRKWTIDYPMLDAYKQQLKITEFLSMQEEPNLIPSDQCGFCSAKHACPALQHTTMRIIELTKSLAHDDLTPLQAGNELKILLDAKKTLEARISGLSNLVENMLFDGKRVPYFSLKPGRGKLAWKKTLSIEEIIVMGNMYGVEIASPVSLITPKQALDKKLPQFIIDDYAEFIPGSLKVTESKL